MVSGKLAPTTKSTKRKTGQGWRGLNSFAYVLIVIKWQKDRCKVPTLATIALNQSALIPFSIILFQLAVCFSISDHLRIPLRTVSLFFKKVIDEYSQNRIQELSKAFSHVLKWDKNFLKRKRPIICLQYFVPIMPLWGEKNVRCWRNHLPVIFISCRNCYMLWFFAAPCFIITNHRLYIHAQVFVYVCLCVFHSKLLFVKPTKLCKL